MDTQFPSRRPCSERLEIKMPTEQKQRIFAVAARQGVSVGQLIRQAVANITSQDNSAGGRL